MTILGALEARRLLSHVLTKAAIGIDNGEVKVRLCYHKPSFTKVGPIGWQAPALPHQSHPGRNREAEP